MNYIPPILFASIFIPYILGYLIVYGFPKFKFSSIIKQHKMLNVKALMKALQFLFFPTLAFLLIVYIWFFDWAKFTNFITADNGWANFFRVLVLVLECVCIYHIYKYYNSIMPNEKLGSKIDGDLLGEKFKYLGKGSSQSNGAYVEFDYDVKKSMAHVLKSDADKDFRIRVFASTSVPNCLIVKAV